MKLPNSVPLGSAGGFGFAMGGIVAALLGKTHVTAVDDPHRHGREGRAQDRVLDQLVAQQAPRGVLECDVFRPHFEGRTALDRDVLETGRRLPRLPVRDR